eukprot:5967520-Alexandrium_andersonii.AAC.1
MEASLDAQQAAEGRAPGSADRRRSWRGAGVGQPGHLPQGSGWAQGPACPLQRGAHGRARAGHSSHSAALSLAGLGGRALRQSRAAAAA